MRAINYKRVGLIMSVVVASTLVWAVSRPWLESTGRFSDIGVMIWPALTFVLAGAVIGLAFLLLEHKADRWAAMLASWASFLFVWKPDIWYASALPVFLLFWLYGVKAIRNDQLDRRKIRVSASLNHGMKPLLLGLFLMVSLGFFLLSSSQKANLSTVSKGIQKSIESAYDSPFMEQQLSQLPPAAQAEVRREVAANVDRTVRAWLGPLAHLVPPILAFGLFIVLWSINIVFRELAVWLGAGLFRLLKKTGFVKIETGKVDSEMLSL